jgi:predicted esterase
MYTFSAGARSLTARVFLRPDAKSAPAPGGPLVLYLHSAGTDWSQVAMGLGQPAIDRIVAQGGVVAAMNALPCLRCGLADDVVWYDEDDAVFDQVVACAVQQAQIDTRRIHAVGFSAGALRSMHLVLARSDYIASVVSYSGGLPLSRPEPQDPANKAPALLSYGAQGIDNAVVDFNLSSRDWYDTYTPRGYYALLCNHGRGHELPPELTPHALRFLLDHPYRAEPEPYKDAIPTELPSYCANTP